MVHERSVYGSLDLLGDLGGVTEVVMIIFGIFLFPVSEHSFTLKAAKKMFIARTKETGLFNPPNPKPNKFGKGHYEEKLS
jgi:hypothetical protein